ncbi:MAG: glycosyltransferase family 4 protein [Clostridium sp.]|nr:glycosyltransferase family 4 protein [Clostridium sp.]
MRVLIVNTSEKTGGAALAANRLNEALTNNGIKSKMLVRDKQSEQLSVVSLPPSPLHKFRFLWERFVIWTTNRLRRENLFGIDIANVGTDITSLPEFKEADVIHLHWINQGYLSIRDIRRILDSGKPVFWTLHDMWPFTGICHYSNECVHYRTGCHHCPQLPGGGGGHDLSSRIFKRKREMLAGHRITFIACSHWMEQMARQSALLADQRIVCLPNALNTTVFHPTSQHTARLQFSLPENRQLLLFGSLKITDKRKGIGYLVEACRLLDEQHPELKEKLGIVVVGKDNQQMSHLFPFPVYTIDYISEERRMARLYAAVDAFVIPSLQDNLPNTIAEAMACGTPCVGFHTGGIPEMIAHEVNGYVARHKDAADLAEGIRYVLQPQQAARLSKAAYRKAVATYNESTVAMKHIELYNSRTTQSKG